MLTYEDGDADLLADDLELAGRSLADVEALLAGALAEGKTHDDTFVLVVLPECELRGRFGGAPDTTFVAPGGRRGFAHMMARMDPPINVVDLFRSLAADQTLLAVLHADGMRAYRLRLRPDGSGS